MLFLPAQVVENMHNRERCLEGFCLAFIILAAVISSTGMIRPLGKIIYDDYSFFDQPSIHYSVKNNIDVPLRSSRVYVSFPELGADAYAQSPYSFTLNPNQVKTQLLFPEFGDTQPTPGWYYARVGFSSQKFRDVRYVPVYLR